MIPFEAFIFGVTSCCGITSIPRPLPKRGGGGDEAWPSAANSRFDAMEKWSANNIPTKISKAKATTMESLFSRVM